MNGFELFLKFDEDDEDSAEILVQGEVQGRPYTFLLDTGTGASALCLDDFTRGFARVGIHESSGIIGNIQDDQITIPNLKLGSVECSSLTVTRLVEESGHRNNLIGMDILKDYCCTFRFDLNRVILGREGVAYPADLNELFLDAKYHPYVPVELMGTEAQAVWDTGASLSCVDMGFIREHREAFVDAGESEGTDASGNTLETPLFMMEGFSCDGHPFPPHKVVGIDLSYVNSKIDHPMTMILGYSTLYKANWLFDFPERKWGILNMLA
jgi:hypothetical protein